MGTSGHESICMNGPLIFSPPHESRALPKIHSLRLDSRSCIPFGFQLIPKIQFVHSVQNSLRKRSVHDVGNRSSASDADGIRYPIDTSHASTVIKRTINNNTCSSSHKASLTPGRALRLEIGGRTRSWAPRPNVHPLKIFA